MVLFFMPVKQSTEYPGNGSVQRRQGQTDHFNALSGCSACSPAIMSAERAKAYAGRVCQLRKRQLVVEMRSNPAMALLKGLVCTL